MSKLILYYQNGLITERELNRLAFVTIFEERLLEVPHGK